MDVKRYKRLPFLASLCALTAIIIVAKNLIPTLPYFHPPQLLPFTDARLESITIEGERTSQTLFQKKGLWVVRKNGADYKADTDKVNGLLKTLHGLTDQNIVSRNRNKFADFGIGKSRVILKTTNKSFTVYVGSTYLGDDSFARIDNQDLVFVGSGLGSLFLDSDYRDLRVPFVPAPSDVQSMEITYEGETALLKRSGDTWHDAQDNPVSDTAANRYLDDISSLTASDILAKQDAKGNALLTVALTLQGKERRARFYPHDETNRLLNFDGATYTYIIPDVYVSALEKKGKDFATIQP